MEEPVIFETAMEKPAGAERDAFLDDACGNDNELRKRIEALLSAHENPVSFLENPVQKVLDAAELDETVIHELNAMADKLAHTNCYSHASRPTVVIDAL